MLSVKGENLREGCQKIVHKVCQDWFWSTDQQLIDKNQCIT